MIFAPFIRAIKIGKMSQTPSHILENLQTALPAVVEAVKGGWDNIQNLAIKTNSSVSLPIWSCTLNKTDSRESDSPQTEDAEEEDDSEDVEKVEEEEDEEEKAAKEKASRKGRKRVTDSNEEIEGAEKPRKRSKVLKLKH
jgi:ribosome biogenesis protein UTP30